MGLWLAGVREVLIRFCNESNVGTFIYWLGGFSTVKHDEKRDRAKPLGTQEMMPCTRYLNFPDFQVLKLF